MLLKQFDLKTNDEELECKTCLFAELIYTDLKGIICTPSSENYKYFLTFVDEYSRYATFYLLKSKEEVCEKFANLKLLLKTNSKEKSRNCGVKMERNIQTIVSRKSSSNPESTTSAHKLKHLCKMTSQNV